MKFGLHFGSRGIAGDPDTLKAVAQKAEALGYEHFGMSDHVIVATEVASAYPYSKTGKFFAQDTGISLEQVTALNTTTAGMIDSTGELLRTQTGAIHEQAASSTIPLETLQRAFQNIYETMDQIDRFKLEALNNMKQTVDTLSTEVEKSKGYIARAEGVSQGKLAGPASPFTPIESK